MSPGSLLQWEPVLRSQIAVALLLLAALVVSTSILLLWVRMLYGRIESLHEEFRRHLESDLTLRHAVDEWAIKELVRTHTGVVDGAGTT